MTQRLRSLLTGSTEREPGPISGVAADAPLLRRLEFVRRAINACLAAASVLLILLLVDGDPSLLELLIGAVLGALAVATLSRHLITLTLARRQVEQDASLRRLVQGLSRSLSPESVVEAVIGDLRTATDADHVVVARVRQTDQVVEVTLAASRSTAPPSRTWLRPDVSELRSERLGREGVDAAADATLEAAAAATAETPGSDAPGGAPPAAVAAAEEIARRVRSAYGLANTLATPLVAERRFLGALLLARRGREGWSDPDRRLLTWAAAEVSAAFARAYTLEAAQRGARLDALTGLPNRRYFDEALAIERPRRRSSDSMGILMIDIDWFKRLNDRYGHATGDQVLRAVADAIAAQVRDDDTPCRYGGEEFAVLLRRASAEQAAEVGERIREAVSRLHPASLGLDERVTVSVGVAVSDADVKDLGSLIERADRALYRAKRQGRDRVVAA